MWKLEVDLKMRKNQAGFRKRRSCQDQIFSLNQLIEKCLDQQLPCLINFIDFKAAFDPVHRPSLWQILRIYGIPSQIVNIIQNYRDRTCVVKSEGSLSTWFRTITGVRHGDIWSPLFLGLAIDFVMNIAVDKDKKADPSTKEKLKVLRSLVVWHGLCRWHSSFWRIIVIKSSFIEGKTWFSIFPFDNFKSPLSQMILSWF